MGWLPRSVVVLVVALVVALALPGVAGAATGSQLWRHLVPLDPALGLVDPFDARVAVSAATGDVYVAAAFHDTGDEGDFVVARYSREGTYKWTRTYDFGASEGLSDLATDTFGNVILCGTSYSNEKGWVGVTIKYSRAGTRRWVRRIDGPGNFDWANETVCGADGVVYTAGIYDSGGTTSSDMHLVKYRADGKRLWQRTYTKSDGAYRLVRGPGGKLYVGGARYGESKGGGVVVIRYRPDGTRDWVRAVGPPIGGAQFIWGLGVSRAGVCVTGQLEKDGSLMGYALKLRLDGTVHWQRPIAYGFYRACGIDGDGRVTVAGSDGLDFVLRRFSAVGRPAGVAEWRGTNETYASSAQAIAVATGGSVFATGYILNNDTGYEVWNVGMDAAWQPLFTVSYGSPTWQDDFGHDIVLAGDSFYVAGVSDGMVLLIKYER